MVMGLNLIIAYVTHKRQGTVSSWDLFAGIVTLALGLLVLLNFYTRFMISIVIIYLFCSVIIFNGLTRIMAALGQKKAGGFLWGWPLVLGIISVIIGVMLCFWPLVAAFTIVFCTAFVLVMQGFNLLSVGVFIDRDFFLGSNSDKLKH
ncbi:MAG: DUF308 domain-containing protein [Bacillota bacterium]|jgi:uncharacterized membrane protein HdeD (DUF308 family)